MNKINTRNEDIRPHFWYFSLWCNFFVFYIDNAMPISIIGLSFVVERTLPQKIAILGKVIIVLANLIKSVFIRCPIFSKVISIFRVINKSVFDHFSVRIKEVLLAVYTVKIDDPSSFFVKIIDFTCWASIEGVF